MIHPLLSHLDHEEYRTYHVNVAKKLKSINAAVFLADLISSFKHYVKQKTIIYSKEHQDYVLFYTHECCTERTVLSRKEQDSAIKLLQELNLIKKFVAGVHGKRHFKINQRELINFLYGDSIKEYEVAQNGQGTLSISDKVDCPKRTKTYKNIIDEHKEERKQQQETSSPDSATPPVVVSESSSLFDTKNTSSTTETELVGEVIRYRKGDGTAAEITLSEIYRHFCKLKYSTEIVKNAIDRFRKQNKPADHILSYIEAICAGIAHSMRSSNKSDHIMQSAEQEKAERQQRREALEKEQQAKIAKWAKMARI